MSTVAISLDRFLDPVVACLSPDVAARLADMRADDSVQKRIDYLADRANEGLLTVEEREEYVRYLNVIDVITVLQAKARAMIRNH